MAGFSWRFRKKRCNLAILLLWPFWEAEFMCDPNSRIVGDLQRSGDEEGTNWITWVFLVYVVFVVRIFLDKATWFFQTFRKDDSKIQTDDRVQHIFIIIEGCLPVTTEETLNTCYSTSATGDPTIFRMHKQITKSVAFKKRNWKPTP